MTGILLAVGVLTSALAAEANQPLTGLRVLLPDGQQISGRLLELNDETLTLQTTWARKCSLPRRGVAAIEQLPGSITIAEDEFREGLKGWKSLGKPQFSDSGMSVNEAGQSLTYQPSVSIEAGTFVVVFREDDTASGAGWNCDFTFSAKDKKRTLSVIVAGKGASYEIMATGIKGTAFAVKRKPGWHRLSLQFSPHSMRLMVDDDLLWFNAKEGQGGPLQGVELACRADKDAKIKGGLTWSEFACTRAIDEMPHPPGDTTQDELWLTSGDQFFGTITRADRWLVELQSRTGKRAVPWAELRGCYPRRSTIPPHTSTGEHVRLVIHSSLSKSPDRLDGVLVELDDKRALLRHVLLGEIAVERTRIKEIERRFTGARHEIETGFHHLGDKESIVGDWPVPKAEGTKWSSIIKLDAAPTSARLVLRVSPLPRGQEAVSRTEVIVNDQRVGYLEGRAGFVSLSLPRGLLKVGENTLEIQSTLGRVGKGRGPCGFEGVVLELSK